MFGTDAEQNSLNLQTGWLCLDFVNTAEWHASDQPIENINNYTELVAWSEQVGILTAEEAEEILAAAERNPEAAVTVYQNALSLREACYRLFSAIAASKRVPVADLQIINSHLSRALPHLQLVNENNAFSWDWRIPEISLERILWPIAHSASQLLTSKAVERVGECADDRGCGWLFLDTSRNKSRRWCDMKSCGNRDKVRRHYQKIKKAD